MPRRDQPPQRPALHRPHDSRWQIALVPDSFKHGLYSKQLIQPGEDLAEFDQLRSTLRTEHQPANTTEEILVDELAQHFWRLRRFREMEARAWVPENITSWIETGLLALITRGLASAERGFFRALTALTKLQKARGFVPEKPQQMPAIDPETVEDHDQTPASAPCDNAKHDETHLLRPQSSPRSPRRIQRTPSHGLA